MADEEQGNTNEEAPKIIVDEDWKSRVQREKEAAEAGGEEAEPEAPAEEEAPEEGEEGQLPQPSFEAVVMNFVSQAMMALGAYPPQEGQQQVYVNLEEAKFLVETLKVLREKTEGNLTRQEQGHLQEAISQLERVMMVRQQQLQEQSMKEAGINLDEFRQQ